MKVNGKIIKHAVKENLIMLMVMYTQENGLIIRLTDLVLIFIRTAHNIKVCGSMIYNMEQVMKNGQMEVLIMEIITKVKNMEEEFTNGQMVANMMVSGLKTKLMVMEFIVG